MKGVENYKQWLKDHHNKICELVAKNGGNLSVNGWGCIGYEPNWPVSVGLEQREAFDLQLVHGMMSGFALGLSEHLEVIPYFYDNHFKQWMLNKGFIHTGDKYERCKHESLGKYIDSRADQVFYCCDVCPAHKMEGSDHFDLFNTGERQFKEMLTKITETDKNSLQ